MGEVLKRIINENAKKEEEKAKKELMNAIRFEIREIEEVQYLAVIENGKEINRLKLNPNSDCCTCPHYVGQCSCNCNGIG